MHIPSDVKKAFYTKVDIEQHIEQYQLYGNLQRRKFYQRYDTDPLTAYQKEMYQKLRRGYSAYSKIELAKMTPHERQQIKHLYHKAERVTNVLKQEVMNARVNKLIDRLYTKRPRKQKPLTILLDVSFSYTTANEKISLSFKDLGITQKMIVDRFIKEGLLPTDFYSLKPKT